MFKREYTQVKDPHMELVNYIRLGGFPATHLREYSQDEVYTIVRDMIYRGKRLLRRRRNSI